MPENSTRRLKLSENVEMPGKSFKLLEKTSKIGYEMVLYPAWFDCQFFMIFHQITDKLDTFSCALFTK